MVLYTPFYQDDDDTRQRELEICLERNIECRWIERIEVFLDAGTIVPAHLRHPKVHWENLGRRCMYSDLIRHANLHCSPGTQAVLANSDIYFDDTLASLAGHDLTGRLLALSRWDVDPWGDSRLIHQPHDWPTLSQDAWIFRAPLAEFFADYYLGILGCDGRIAWEARAAGLEVVNPCQSIRAHHLHLSSKRNYSPRDRYPGPYMELSHETLSDTLGSIIKEA